MAAKPPGPLLVASSFGWKVLGSALGVPRLRTTVFWASYWGPLILLNYHIQLHTSEEKGVSGSVWTCRWGLGFLGFVGSRFRVLALGIGFSVSEVYELGHSKKPKP